MSSKNSGRDTLAFICLVMAALFWGISYPLTKYVENCPTFYIIALRFGIASVLLAIILIRHFRNMTKDTLYLSFILSICILGMYIFNIVGVKYTTAVRASFFTTLSFLIVPVINLVIYRIKISRFLFASAGICLVGMFLLCYTPEMGSVVVNFGDVLCLLAAVCGGINIIFMEHVSRKPHIDSPLFTTCLLGWVALWGLIIGFFTGDLNYTPESSSQLIAIIVMALFCSTGAFILQIFGSKYVSSNRVGIIFSLEPASGCILSVLVLKESMTWVGWLGAATIMFSIIYMELANSRHAAKELEKSAADELENTVNELE